MAEARDATIGGAGGGGAAAAAATDDEWDIHDRLKNLLSMFATSGHSCKYFGRSFSLFLSFPASFLPCKHFCHSVFVQLSIKHVNDIYILGLMSLLPCFFPLLLLFSRGRT
jgi:hypothetical protein